MHEPPQVSHLGPGGKGTVVRPGMVLAIEPQANRGRRTVRMLPDGRTAETVDGSPSAHCEHSVAITHGDPWILTEPDPVDLSEEERIIRQFAAEL